MAIKSTTQKAKSKKTELEKQAYNITKQFNLSDIFQKAPEYAQIIGYGLKDQMSYLVPNIEDFDRVTILLSLITQVSPPRF